MQSNAVEDHCSQIGTFKLILHALAGILILLLADLSVSLFFDFIFSFLIPIQWVGWFCVACRQIARIFVSYGLLWVYIRKIFDGSMSDFRVKRPYFKVVYLFCAVLLPTAVTLCLIATGGTWRYNQMSNAAVFGTVVIALCSALAAGIVEEIIFRGYMMKLLELKWGKTVAVLVPSLVFGALHVTSMGKFDVISFLQLLCAGTAVGVMFSLITYQSKSIWPSALVHSAWNFAMIGGVLAIETTHNTRAVFSFVLSSQNALVTGGAFGVEASVIAIVGYLLVAALALYLYKNKNARNWEGLGGE